MGSEQEAGCDFEAMSATTEEHKLLEPFVGTFKATVKMWMGPGDPMVSTGVMTNELDLGGRFLKHTYKGDPGEGPFPNFEGRGFWGYNTVAKKWEGVWIDTASTMVQTERGDRDASGKVWEMKGQMDNPQMPGGKWDKRSVITLVDNDNHTMEMFMPGPDGKECKGMEITYVRRG